MIPSDLNSRRMKPHGARPRNLIWLVAVLLLPLGVCRPAVLTGQAPGELPSYKNGNWVVDHAQVIPAYAKKQLLNLCNEINNFQRAEMVILTVNRTGAGDPRKFALQYFNRERIGDTRNNNGVLILCSMEDRAIEIILGDGLNTPANERATEKVIDELVIPKMKRNDVAGAMFGGAFGMAREVMGYANLAENIPRSNPELETADERRLRLGGNQSWTRLYLFLLGGGLFIVLGIGIIVARYRVRYGKRKCEKCHHDMIMLDEQQDDTLLDPPEIIEEELGSVDYDVWACQNCDHVLKYRYGAFFTRYSRCPRCRYKTRSKVSRTLRSATTSRGGLVRVDEQCANCSYHNTYTYSTPRVSKSSSGGGWSGGGHSSSGGFSGGGGGRSGGFSSGGGASGRW